MRRRCIAANVHIAATRRRHAGTARKTAPASDAVFRDEWSRPISRVLSWAIIPLGRASPHDSSNQPGDDAGHVMVPLFGLAPGGVCRAGPLPDSRCALTAPFHPCLIRPRHRRCGRPLDVRSRERQLHRSSGEAQTAIGGLLSVALSVGSRRPGVTWHPALWSPDFPRGACAPRDCLADSAHSVPRRCGKPCRIDG